MLFVHLWTPKWTPMTLYFILKNYIRQRDGKSNVLLTIQSGTKKKRVATSVFIEPKYFSNKHNQWIKRSHPRHAELNTHLAEFYNKHRSEDVTTSIPSLSACIDQYLNSSFFWNTAPRIKKGYKVFLQIGASSSTSLGY